MCNYLLFHDDIRKLDRTNGDGITTGPPLEISSAAVQSPLQQVMLKISNAVYKNGVRTTEFFKDHDKLNSGIITENQVRTNMLYEATFCYTIVSFCVACHFAVASWHISVVMTCSW